MTDTHNRPVPHRHDTRRWQTRYFLCIAVIAMLWALAYVFIHPAASWLVYDLLGFAAESRLGESIHFFLYDTVKIFLLLTMMVYLMAWLRATLKIEKVRDFLSGKGRGIGYLMGSGFGAVTPFCSCSSIPLFLGFSAARIPVGVTMAFLITSPVINEVAIILLWELLGWKFTLVYITIGMLAGILGGILMDNLHAERWLQPFLRQALESKPGKTAIPIQVATPAAVKTGLAERHIFAWSETSDIVRRVWIWIIAGVAAGALLHGYVPETWFVEHLGQGQWWSVPLSVMAGIPLYANVTGIIPVMQSLLTKGLPVGTTLAFCMSTVAASLPEVLMLRQVMKIRLLAFFLLYLLIIFTLTGWFFNFFGSWIL
ncbi:permease [Oxalobacter sp. OttesenSCG-928-P03]|nr:permease [Oxalobacter sp. OttesenSCG-928-P03]